MSKYIISIGRDPRNDVRIDERWDTVSNQHCDIRMDGDQLIFTDHSSNGTVINGQKIQNRSVGIYPGDKILLANVFELEWTVINSFFKIYQRPTVTRNVRGGDSSGADGRRTVKFEQTSGQTNHGRKTEQLRNGSGSGNGVVANNGGQQSSSFGHANDYSQSDIDKEIEKWNWGAFFCNWLWAVFNGIYWPALVLLVMLLPYLGQVCCLCLSVYLGLNGSKMAWRTGKFKEFTTFKKHQHYWAIGGLVWFVINLCASFVVLNYTLSIL